MPKPRMLSLDVLRGLTMALMILVNTAGDGAVSYAQLRHSAWNGCTLTDVVFPLFLFMMGASVVLSFTGRLARGAARATIARQVARRALLIFALGLLLNALPFFQLSHLRVYGVLQRIALCYLIAALVFLAGGLRAVALAVVAALLGYWLLLTRVPVPGFGLPGRDIPLLDPHGNLTAWLDRQLLPPAHLYHFGFYDPEGLLSTLAALANTLFGMLAAAALGRTTTSASPAAFRRQGLALLAAGLLLATAGLLWSHTLPLNKRLWTPSFALFTSGIACILLSLFHLALDRPNAPQPPPASPLLQPALVFGTNALAAYMLSEVLAIILLAIPAGGGFNLQQRLYHLLPAALGPAPFRSLVYSILYVGLCYLPILALYRRRIFLKL